MGRLTSSVRFVGRHRRRIGVGLLAVACFAGGVTLGWTVRDGRDEPATELVVSVDRPVVDASSAGAGVGAAPNVLGLTRDEARQVLVDAGIDADRIELTTVPSAGEPGLVVTQEPASGSPVPDGPFALGVSEATTVPELVGRPAEDARGVLAGLGARVRSTARYDPGVAEGTVLATDPPAGAPLGPDVSMVVAAPPSSVFLADLDPVDGGCSEGDASVDGTELRSSLRCSVADPDRQPDPVVYLVDRAVSSLTMTVGQDDRSEPGTVVRFLLRGDDRVLAEGTVAYGQAVPVEVDLRGVLRLSLGAVLADERPDGVDRPALVFGSARLVGGPDEIDALLG